MSDLSYSDEFIKNILDTAKTIALVGASPKPDRPSHEVMHYLQERGYRVIPVNPGLAGKELLGETVFASVSDIKEPIDMVDIFRTSDAVPELVDEAIAAKAKYVWTQLGVRHDEAAEKAQKAGIAVVMNRCPKQEIERMKL